MIALAQGLIQFFHHGLHLPLSMTLILAAVFFVLSASFFERYEVGSVVWSMLVSVIATAMLTLLAGGIIQVVTRPGQSWEELLSALAICMIVAMILLSHLK